MFITYARVLHHMMHCGIAFSTKDTGDDASEFG